MREQGKFFALQYRSMSERASDAFQRGEQRGREQANSEWQDFAEAAHVAQGIGYEQGQRDERERIDREVKAVMAGASPEWKEALAVVMGMILNVKGGSDAVPT
jgi:hypothetical protein